MQETIILTLEKSRILLMSIPIPSSHCMHINTKRNYKRKLFWDFRILSVESFFCVTEHFILAETAQRAQSYEMAIHQWINYRLCGLHYYRGCGFID
jgi:hypothetical protein